jgi:hypothetical protein
VSDLGAVGGGSVEGTVLNLAAPGRGMQSASASPLRGVQVGLLGMSGKFAGKSYRVTKTPTLIGRTTGEIVLADNQVSGRHAQLDVLIDHASLKDLASTNGDGERSPDLDRRGQARRRRRLRRYRVPLRAPRRATQARASSRPGSAGLSVLSP